MSLFFTVHVLFLFGWKRKTRGMYSVRSKCEDVGMTSF